MRTINGKLIHQETNQFEEIVEITANLHQRCSDLETQYSQNCSQEIDVNRSYLQKLEQRIGFLEEVTANQARQLFYLKIGAAIATICLWVIFSMNNQSNQPKNSYLEPSNDMELVQL